MTTEREDDVPSGRQCQCKPVEAPVMGRQQVIDALCKVLGVETKVNDRLLARDLTVTIVHDDYPIVTVNYMVMPLTDAAAQQLKAKQFRLVGDVE